MTPRQLSEPCRPLPTPHGRLLLHLALVFVTSPSQPSSPLSTFDVDGMKRTCALLPSSLVATQFSVVLSSGGGVEVGGRVSAVLGCWAPLVSPMRERREGLSV
ncbi:Os03g0602851 [Oryza sativa Japonica Group]|uniref:Os03g0602851 protein n=1 Tax=Oryza sativa subsp. japonica TaxID=39947 RepID=A0A0P0W0U4_ORYSJ|nr:Os03g0602851 [Oryza sativa Japonica Group]